MLHWLGHPGIRVLQSQPNVDDFALHFANKTLVLKGWKMNESKMADLSPGMIAELEWGIQQVWDDLAPGECEC